MEVEETRLVNRGIGIGMERIKSRRTRTRTRIGREEERGKSPCRYCTSSIICTGKYLSPGISPGIRHFIRAGEKKAKSGKGGTEHGNGETGHGNGSKGSKGGEDANDDHGNGSKGSKQKQLRKGKAANRDADAGENDDHGNGAKGAKQQRLQKGKAAKHAAEGGGDHENGHEEGAVPATAPEPETDQHTHRRGVLSALAANFFLNAA